MKTYLLLSILSLPLLLPAQEFQEISTGAGYGMQGYSSLATGSSHQRPNSTWDIAFSVAPQDAGVFINESVGSAMGAVPIRAYYTLSNDFSLTPDSAIFNDFPLQNTEESWSWGALNEIRSESPLDFGWGMYNPSTQEITGGEVFVIQLRNGDYLKLQVQSLIGGAYTFRFADLDGTNEVQHIIDKSAHTGKVLAYYSLTNQTPVDIEPADGYDFLFCRYFSYLDDGGGDSLLYLVTGVLTAPGLEVAQADGIDPATVSYDDYAGALSSDIEIIGQDWKSFNLGTFAWEIVQNRVYFVRTHESRVWKIQFIDFEGSSTGNAVFEKTDLGIISSISDPASPLSAFEIYPNPATQDATVLFAAKGYQADDARLEVTDIYGHEIASYPITVSSALEYFNLSVQTLPAGIYYIRLSVGQSTEIRPLVVGK